MPPEPVFMEGRREAYTVGPSPDDELWIAADDEIVSIQVTADGGHGYGAYPSSTEFKFTRTEWSRILAHIDAR